MMRMMGENDIINRIRTMPGVSTSGDYGSGLNVDGADASQAIYRIDGTPIFFPYRFGGLFSTFNTYHFRSATFERNAHAASMPSRLGPKIDFETYESIATKLSGYANVGMLSSSISLRSALGRRCGLIMSARVSYVNQLYSKLLRFQNAAISYDFSDLNFTFHFKPDSIDHLSINAFASYDNLNYDDVGFALDTHIPWQNNLISAKWSRAGRLPMTHRVYYTGFRSKMELDMPQLWLKVPSQIQALGISGDFTPAINKQRMSVSAGYELNLYRIKPQQASSSGFSQIHVPASGNFQTPLEARVYGDLDYILSNSFKLRGGLSLIWFRNESKYNRLFADPRVSAIFMAAGGELTLHAGIYHQYLHRVGLSEIGMASDFWIGADRRNPAQRSYSFSADYDRKLGFAGLTLNAGIYWRRILSQPEYNGQIFDLLSDEYNAMDYIISASGYNTGFNIALRRETGWLTGSASLSYGMARRHYQNTVGYSPARIDPGLSAALNLDWRFTRHWSSGINFIYAQGRRYTQTEAIYVIAGNVVCIYGNQNSARLPAYHRLDLGATYRFSTGKIRHFANLSIINAYGHRNIEMQTFVLDIEKGNYRLKQTASLYRFVPSISYSIEF